jgi:hypothetical protein
VAKRAKRSKITEPAKKLRRQAKIREAIWGSEKTRNQCLILSRPPRLKCKVSMMKLKYDLIKT